MTKSPAETYHRFTGKNSTCDICGVCRSWVGKRNHRVRDWILTQYKKIAFGQDKYDRDDRVDSLLPTDRIEPVNLIKVSNG